MLLIHFMGANLNKNPETSKCFGTFLSKKKKKLFNHNFETLFELVHVRK